MNIKTTAGQQKQFFLAMLWVNQLILNEGPGRNFYTVGADVAAVLPHEITTFSSYTLVDYRNTLAIL